MGSSAEKTFFVLEPLFESVADTELIPVDPVFYGEAPRCGYCDNFLGMKSWLPPRRAEVRAHGLEWGDFAFFTDTSFVVADRIVEILKLEGLTGLNQLEEMEIVRSRGLPFSPRYFYGQVNRSRAAVDERNSSVVRSGPPSCPECRSNGIQSIDGFSIEVGSWSGEDIFIARGLPGLALTSQKLADAADQYHFTNVKLVPTSSYFWDPLRR